MASCYQARPVSSSRCSSAVRKLSRPSCKPRGRETARTGGTPSLFGLLRESCPTTQSEPQRRSQTYADDEAPTTSSRWGLPRCPARAAQTTIVVRRAARSDSRRTGSGRGQDDVVVTMSHWRAHCPPCPTVRNTGSMGPAWVRIPAAAADRLAVTMVFDYDGDASSSRHLRKNGPGKLRPGRAENRYTAEYPRIFRVSRDTGLSGLVIRGVRRGPSGAILGLTIAMERVAKDSNTAARLMCCSPPVPTWDRMIVGGPTNEKQKKARRAQQSPRGNASRFRPLEPQAGKRCGGHAHQAVLDGDSGCAGNQVRMSGVVQARPVLRVRKTGPANRANHTRTSRASSFERSAGCQVGAPTTRCRAEGRHRLN